MWLIVEDSAYLGIKIVATALSVFGVILAASRLGSTIGGLLAGLPIVAGPAMYFLWREFGAEFTATASASSLMSLSASQAFLVVYCLSAVRHGGRSSLAQASIVWLLAAFFLSFLPQIPALGLTLFALATFGARVSMRRFALKCAVISADSSLVMGLIVARAIAAGIVVALATLVAAWLGADWAGVIAAYPIGFSFVILTLHRGSSSARAIATSHVAMLGLLSLAIFVFTLSVAIPVMAAGLAFALALASGTVTTGVTYWMSARG